MGWYFWDSLNNFPNNLSSNCFIIIWCSLPESIVGRWKELQNGDWSNRTIFFYICYPELLILYKKELYLQSPPSPSSFFFFPFGITIDGLMGLKFFFIVRCHHFFLILQLSQVCPVGFPSSKRLCSFAMTPLVFILFIWHKMFQISVIFFFQIWNQLFL